MPKSPNIPEHVAIALSDYLLNCISPTKIEKELYKIANLLLQQNISFLTIYNPNGRLNEFLGKKFHKKDGTASSENCLMYSIRRKDGFLKISEYEDGEGDGLLMSIIDSSFGHSKILECRINDKRSADRDEWMEHNNFKYKIPSDDDILQPELVANVCNFGNVRLKLPDMVISLKPSPVDTFIHFLKNFFKIANFKANWSVFSSTLLMWLGSKLIGDTKIIYPFGRLGVQPLFLADAEIYQSFGLNSDNIQTFIDTFKDTKRNFGK